MKDFKDKVAVVTGAASGIGRAIAGRCAKEGMRVVLADINKEGLAAAEAELNATGATVLSVPTDVSKASEIEALAQKTLEAFGAVHLLFNNAAVWTTGTIWENTLTDWEWVLGVNLWGVINGVRIFVPLMLEQNTEGRIINSSSMTGLTYSTNIGSYTVTKHGIVALSETLYHELEDRGSKLKVSVLCPGVVNTGIPEAARNRPADMKNVPGEREEDEQMIGRFRKLFKTGMDPDEVADIVFDAIREDKFYILTHPEEKFRVRERMENILQERNPTRLLQPSEMVNEKQ
jgi:NAD(P)-dependent dehydrogenase (short-subunit alcohol dehydrogenase family)